MAREETGVLIDEATLRTFHPKQARLNLDGVEMEAPKMVLSFEVDVDRVSSHMNTLTKLFRKRGAVRLSLDFIEQLELPRKSAESNGHAQDTGALSGVVPIGGGTKTQKGEKART